MTHTVVAPLIELTRSVSAAAQSLGRSDLSQRLNAAITRAMRPATVVCVVGEFKQGKSSLINGLLGEDLCPVDDDLATSTLTLLRYGPEPVVTVRRGSGEEATVEQVPTTSLADWATEAGNPDNNKGVERVDVILPHPLLAQGLVLVDSPGMGGLGAGHAAATMAFLPFADGLILTTDVSAELSQPELELLERARGLCPFVVLAQTKIDLYPEWRRIEELNRGHLARRGIELVTVPLSTVLRRTAAERRDPDLDRRSGYPALLTALGEQVIAPARTQGSVRLRDEVGDALTQLGAPLHEELSVLADPDRAHTTIQQLEAAKTRLEHLRGPGARWNLVLSDRTTDLSNDVTYLLRGGMRITQREMDESVESLKTPEDWDGLATRLQTAMAEIITQAFVEVEEGGRRIQEEIIELLADDSVELTSIGSTTTPLDVAELWRGKGIHSGSKAGAALGTALTGLRGAQSGMIMLGMVGQFLPRGATLLLMSNPVTLGLGAAFAGMQVLDAHKRKIQARRQQARTQVRQFLDDVQFESGHRLNDALRALQRSLRDEFSERITDLQRTYGEAHQLAQQALQRDQESAVTRKAELEVRIRALETLRQQLTDVAATA